MLKDSMEKEEEFVTAIESFLRYHEQYDINWTILEHAGHDFGLEIRTSCDDRKRRRDSDYQDMGGEPTPAMARVNRKTVLNRALCNLGMALILAGFVLQAIPLI